LVATFPSSSTLACCVLVLFALQHSSMARTTFSQWWQRHFYPPLERSIYAGISGLLLFALLATWHPIPGEPLWSGPAWVSGIAIIGGMGIVLVNLRFDHLGLLGLRQLREAGEKPIDDLLLIVGPYRFVRHPVEPQGTVIQAATGLARR
jgi:protein-S-isoprenylcysteine O-methyltransferase Ste14